MRRRVPLLLVLGLSACGTSNSANTVSTVTVTRTETTAQQTSTSSLAPPSTTSTPATATRTQTAPSFTGGTSAGSGSGAHGAAVAKLHALGYSPLDTSSYHSDQTLRVLIGSAGQRRQHAFFFSGARYLGTDASSASAAIRVVGQSDTAVTLSYTTRSGSRNVRFQLDMGHLSPIDPLPSAAERQ